MFSAVAVTKGLKNVSISEVLNKIRDRSFAPDGDTRQRPGIVDASMKSPLKLLNTAVSDGPHERPRTASGIIVLGMHRTGTSAITGVFADFGFEVPGRLAPPGQDNPKGYFESVDFVEIHDEFLHAVGRTWSDPRWMDEQLFLGAEAIRAKEQLQEAVTRSVLPLDQWILKDPRMCRLMPLWEEILAAEVFDPHFLHILRSPLSVAASLEQRDGFSKEKSFLLWLRHCLDAEKATRGSDRTWLHFEELSEPKPHVSIFDRVRAMIGSSRGSAEKLERTLEKVVTRKLVHHKHTKEETLERLQSHPWVASGYRALDSLSAGENDQALAELDQLWTEIHNADRLLFGYRRSREAEEHGERYQRLGKDIERFHRSIDTQRQELEAQRAELAAMRDAFVAERERLEVIRQEIAQQHHSAEGRSLELAKRQEIAEGQRQGISESLNSLAAQRQQLEAVQQAIDGVAQRQDMADSLHRVTSQAIDNGREVMASIADGTSEIQTLISERLEKRHLTLLQKSLEVISHLETDTATTRQHLVEATQRREEEEKFLRHGITESLNTLTGQQQQLEAVQQAVIQVAQQQADSTSEIQKSISERLEKRHLTLLQKSLGVISHLESEIVSARNRLDGVTRERDGALLERHTAIEERNRAITERERWVSERNAAIASREAEIEKRSRAIVERDRWLSERDVAVASLETATEERSSALVERERWLSERDAALTDLEVAVEERDRAITEAQQERSVSQAAEAALTEQQQALAASRAELDRLLHSRLWKLTSPMRWLFTKLRARDRH